MRVVQLLGRSAGGIGTHVAHLTRQLRDAGDEVVVVGPPDTLGRFDLGGAWAWWPLSRSPRELVDAARGLARARALLASADVVHAHGHQAGLVGALLLARPGRRSWRGVSLGRRRRRRLGGGSAGPRLIVSWHNAVLAPGGDRHGIPKSRADLRDIFVAGSNHHVAKIGTRGEGRRVRVQGLVARRADLVTGASSDLVAEARRLGASRAVLAPVPSPRVPALLARPRAEAAIRREEAARLLERAGVVTVTGEPGVTGVAGMAGARLPMVVTVCRIAPQKDLPVLVDAAARLAGECVWVVVGAGDPDLARRVRERAARLGAPVHLLGGRDDVDDWLRAAEVFALPSRWEARALVVQEAMAAGTPVVASDVGGLHDLVEQVGSLVPVGDPAALAAAVRAVLGDPQLRDNLARRGRAAARALPDEHDMTAMWRGWYAGPVAMT